MGYDMYRENADNRNDGDGYYRLNVWGMSEARPILAKFGIVRWADSPPPPDGEKFGITEYFDEAVTPEQKSYALALEQWRDGPNGEGPGIPSYKLGSNDGWLVLPLEIRSGIGFADANHPNWRKVMDDWVLEFVVWMEGSTDGFRVW